MSFAKSKSKSTNHMSTITTHTNQNGVPYYSTTNDNGETIYSFTTDFEDIWLQEDEESHAAKMKNGAITKALAKFAPETRLCTIDADEFETGGAITNALRAAGYDESGMIVINNLKMWGSTVWELESLLID
jgi:hypothetical protein